MPNVLDNRCQLCNGGVCDENNEEQEAEEFDETVFRLNNGAGIMVRGAVLRHKNLLCSRPMP